MDLSFNSYVTFDNVKVPVENLIGKENQGFKYIMYKYVKTNAGRSRFSFSRHSFNHERLSGIIHAVRFSRELMRDATQHAHQREAFGKKLIQSKADEWWVRVCLTSRLPPRVADQVIRYKLANMARQV